MSNEFISLELTKILISGKQPRKTFRDESLKELAASIKKNGVIQPVLVRAANAEGFHELIAGERRVRASMAAKQATIPAIVREDPDRDILQLQIIENLQREGINYFEEAVAIKKMRDELDLDVTEIKMILGKGDMYIYCSLQLASAAEEVQTAAAQGHLGKDVAWRIARLPDAEKQVIAVRALARSNRQELVSTAAAKKYIAEKFEGKISKRGKHNGIQAALGSDFKANWKKYLLWLTADEFEGFKRIVRGKTETDAFANAIDILMSKRGTNL